MARPTRICRALSQNLLADRTAAGQLARLAVPHGREAPLLLEVGAGKGALTGLLAPRCRRLLAYEIDPRLVPAVRSRFSNAPQVRLVGRDFLTARFPRTPYSVAGNGPSPARPPSSTGAGGRPTSPTSRSSPSWSMAASAPVTAAVGPC